MRVVFNGMTETVTKGCVPCGRASKSSKAFISSKSVILPSGQTKMFHRNKPVEVSKIDGEWLLSWKEKDKSGLERSVFSEVTDD